VPYLERVMNARSVAGAVAGSLDVKSLECESDGAAHWLTDNVHTLLVVRVRVWKERRRYVARLFHVHSAADFVTQTRKQGVMIISQQYLFIPFCHINRTHK